MPLMSPLYMGKENCTTTPIRSSLSARKLVSSPTIRSTIRNTNLNSLMNKAKIAENNLFNSNNTIRQSLPARTPSRSVSMGPNMSTPKRVSMAARPTTPATDWTPRRSLQSTSNSHTPSRGSIFAPAQRIATPSSKRKAILNQTAEKGERSKSRQQGLGEGEKFCLPK